MSESKKLSVEAAWNALWNARSPFFLPSTFQSRRHVGQVWLAYIPQIAVPDTGPVVLMNKEPWGVVTVNLKNAAVSNLHTVEPIGISHNAATGEVTAQVQFRSLHYAGDYEVRRGTPTASALKLASAQMRRPDTLDSGDPNDQIGLAKSYQDKLSLESGPNGSIMLDSVLSEQRRVRFGVWKSQVRQAVGDQADRRQDRPRITRRTPQRQRRRATRARCR